MWESQGKAQVREKEVAGAREVVVCGKNSAPLMQHRTEVQRDALVRRCRDEQAGEGRRVMVCKWGERPD